MTSLAPIEASKPKSRLNAVSRASNGAVDAPKPSITAAFELIAICWEQGARSAIHDHADSDCAFVLQRGAITCENYRVAYPDGFEKGPHDLRRTTTRTLREGEIDMRSGHLSVHRVGACDGRAVTLHVYAKPIDACTVFEEDGSARVVRSRYDSVPASVSAQT